MKKILYKSSGGVLLPNANGVPVRSSIDVAAESPYSVENLKEAEQHALPDTLKIQADPEEAPAADPTDAAQPWVVLTDRATGELYQLWVERGKLMMEVL